MQAKRAPHTFNLFLNLVVILSLLLPNASALSAAADRRGQLVYESKRIDGVGAFATACGATTAPGCPRP